VLTKLTVKDYALIESLEVEFGPGLNILTGETGAGKSILIGALGLVLGERADADAVRTGAKQTVVEAELRLAGGGAAAPMLEQAGLEPADELVVRREVSASGKSRAFINDSPATMGLLKAFGDAVLDMHGQHQHQSLLHEERHLEFLDAYGKLKGKRDLVSELYRQHQAARRQLEEAVRRDRLTKERIDLYKFQVREIASAKLAGGEEEELERERTVLENAEKLHTLAANAYGLLYDNEGSILARLGQATGLLKEVSAIDGRARQDLESLESATAQLEEACRSLRQYRDRLQFNSGRLEEIRDRLDLIRTLKKKYGRKDGPVQEVLEHAAKIQAELDGAERGEEIIARLTEKLEAQRSELETEALSLSADRQRVAGKMAREVAEQLGDLGMEKALFTVEVSQTSDPDGQVADQGQRYRADEDGIDGARFLISSNAGEDLRPLAKIASGGEISRAMLAIKSILAEVDSVPVLVFDEIDVGIGGRVAEAVGRKLREIGARRQVLCITHLPQIAAQAQAHFRVVKNARSGRTVTTVERLWNGERVEEVARMLGGEKITEAALKHAREMVGNA